MLRCEDCEFFNRAPDGSPILACDPFSTIKEVECLAKWQVAHLMSISQSHEASKIGKKRAIEFFCIF